MHRAIQAIISTLNSINEFVGRSVAWLNVLLIILICYDVFMRKLFKITSVAIFEMEWHLFAMIFLLSAGFTLKHDRHVRVDVFYGRFSKRVKAWVNLTGTLLFLIPLCWMTINSGWLFTKFAYVIHEQSSDPGGLPARYLIKAVIMVGFFFLLLQALSLALQSVLEITTKKSSLLPDSTLL